jgi:hypothetical protein
MDDRYLEVKEVSGNDETYLDKQSTTLQPDVVTSDYSYGRNQEPLDPQSVRGSTTQRHYQTVVSVSATGNLTITGCPFTPKYVRVTAVRGFTGCTSQSFGSATASPGSVVANYDGNTSSSNSYIVIVSDNSGTTVSRATFTNFTSDGCVINFSTQSGTTYLLVEFFA